MKRDRGRIAFLDSPYILTEPFFQHMPPLSILYLASYAEKCGFEPSIYALNKSVKERGLYYFGFDIPSLIDSLKRFAPDMIAITCPYSSRWRFVRRFVSLIKSYFPNTPIALGGIHPTTFPEYCLSDSDADYVVIGEGELTMIELAEHILSNRPPYNLDGIAFFDAGRFILNPKTRFIDDLDSLPPPAYHHLDIERYKKICRNDTISQLRGMYFSLLTSRSCPFQCTYCNMHIAHGKKWRARSPENVMAEISYLVNKYKVNQFAIVDDNFTLSKRRTIDILKLILNSGIPAIKFITPNGLSAKTLDEEVIFYLKQAGALEIAIAIESGSEYIRNVVYNKRLPTEKVLEVVAACKKYRLPCKAFFMVGAPEESEDTINQTIELIRRIKIPAYFNITTPYKGTRLYDYYLEKGIVNEDDLKQGRAMDLRLPVEKSKDYAKIIRWRRKLQVFNIIYAWKDIITNSRWITFNNFRRLITTSLFPTQVTEKDIDRVLEKNMAIK